MLVLSERYVVTGTDPPYAEFAREGDDPSGFAGGHAVTIENPWGQSTVGSPYVMEPMRARPEPNPPESSSPEATPNWINRRATEQAVRAAHARRASGRRRFVDPTTCERDYSTAELEFMQAMQEYKQKSGRMFPTWSEVLEVLRDLGYRKPPGELGDDESLPDVGDDSPSEPIARTITDTKPADSSSASTERLGVDEGPVAPAKPVRRRKPGPTPTSGDCPTPT